MKYELPDDKLDQVGSSNLNLNRLQEFSDDIVVMPNRSKEEVDAGLWDRYTLSRYNMKPGGCLSPNLQ